MNTIEAGKIVPTHGEHKGKPLYTLLYGPSPRAALEAIASNEQEQDPVRMAANALLQQLPTEAEKAVEEENRLLTGIIPIGDGATALRKCLQQMKIMLSQSPPRVGSMLSSFKNGPYLVSGRISHKDMSAQIILKHDRFPGRTYAHRNLAPHEVDSYIEQLSKPSAFTLVRRWLPSDFLSLFPANIEMDQQGRYLDSTDPRIKQIEMDESQETEVGGRKLRYEEKMNPNDF